MEYKPIEEVMKYLPHEEINQAHVLSIASRLRKELSIVPLCIYKNIIMDGHHRYAAIEYLFKNYEEWKEKQIPIYEIDEFEVEGSTVKRVIEAAHSGKLLPCQSTYVSPRVPETRMQII